MLLGDVRRFVSLIGDSGAVSPIHFASLGGSRNSDLVRRARRQLIGSQQSPTGRAEDLYAVLPPPPVRLPRRACLRRCPLSRRKLVISH